MNPTLLLYRAEQAMSTCKDRFQYRYALYFFEGALLCTPVKLMPIDAHLVYYLTRRQLQDGLSPKEWQELQAALITAYQEVKL